MTTIITIPRKFADRIPAARSFLENVAKHDPCWNGAAFEIEEGDSYSISSSDEIASTVLYRELGASIGLMNN